MSKRTARSLKWFAGMVVVLGVYMGASLTAQHGAPAPVPPAGTAAPSASQPAAEPTADPTAAPTPDPEAEANAQKAAEAKAMLADWRMIVVSPVSPMPEDYTVEASAALSDSTNNTLQVEAAEHFVEMQKAAKADGVSLHLQSGYRSVSYQAGLFKKQIEKWKATGMDEAAATEKAATVVTPPGCSEHNCGLAADINCPQYYSLDSGFGKTAAYAWLCEHAADYGFIERYPEGKQAVTGIIPEAWHWRYVGVENAAAIKASGLCLEEFTAQLQADAALA